MRVAFDFHQVGQLNAVILGNVADVVPAQIDEHDVFGPFLGVRQQFRRQGTILGLVTASPPGARQGPDGDGPVLDPDQDFRRTADQVEIVEAQKEQKRAGIEHPEHPVDVQRSSPGLKLKPLAGHDLKDIAGLDVFLAVPDDLLVGLSRKVGRWQGAECTLGVQITQCELGSRCGEPSRPAHRPGHRPTHKPLGGSIS